MPVVIGDVFAIAAGPEAVSKLMGNAVEGQADVRRGEVIVKGEGMSVGEGVTTQPLGLEKEK